MAKRLVKIAKELNVGTGTIVDYLLESGFEIENRATAKITEEMYEELLKKYEGSIDVKKRADKIDIGSTRSKKSQEQKDIVEPNLEESKDSPENTKDEKEVEPDSTPSPMKDTEVKSTSVDKTPESTVKSPESEEKVTAKTDTQSEKKKIPEEKKSSEEEKKQGLKIVGNVDLKGSTKQKKKEKTTKSQEKEIIKNKSKEEKIEEKIKEEKKTAEKVSTPLKKKDKDQKESAEKKKEKKKKTAELEDDTIKRASKPQLKGLKVKGNIGKEKLKSIIEEKKKKKKKKKKVSDDNKGKRPRKRFPRKRRRIRKKSGKKYSTEEQKEVTKKEIDEKIKATMAKISGTSSKNKRKERKKKKKEDLKEKQLKQKEELVEEDNILEVTEFVSVSELASLMNVQPTDIITKCMNLGIIVSINQRLDAEVIELVASEFEYEVEFISAEEHSDDGDDWEDDPEDMEPRASIITVMGHVDHGKTSLLDYIRKASVASGEAGGITQHIGAYEVVMETDDGDKRITFLDTPGHEAFTAMRARGAKITDVAVIIIAADDEIMPQTKEAISHAEAAGVPIVFAINKIDKPNADPKRIINGLAQMNYLVEEWGGKYQSQQISAKTGEGIEELLEKIILEADLLELEANPHRPAIGAVLEASLDKGRGYIAKLLVQEGTLKIGDAVVAGGHAGKVKAMFNEMGQQVTEVGPSQPTLMLGLSGAPQAGEKFKVMENERDARNLANSREQIIREQANRAKKRISLDEIGRRLALGNFKELNLIVKGDVDGSVEALSDSLIKQSVETIQVNVIHKAVGQIIESDVLLASASDAIIIGFQVRPSLGARQLAEKEGIQIKTYSVIYEAIEEVRAAMEGMLEPEEEEKIVGEVVVREIYKISKVGTVAGCYVQDGYISRNSHIRVIRDGIVLYPKKEGVVGELKSLKRFKEDMKTIKVGLECGLTLENFNDLKVGDVIETYEIIEVEQTL